MPFTLDYAFSLLSFFSPRAHYFSRKNAGKQKNKTQFPTQSLAQLALPYFHPSLRLRKESAKESLRCAMHHMWSRALFFREEAGATTQAGNIEKAEQAWRRSLRHDDASRAKMSCDGRQDV